MHRVAGGCWPCSGRGPRPGSVELRVNYSWLYQTWMAKQEPCEELAKDGWGACAPRSMQGKHKGRLGGQGKSMAVNKQARNQIRQGASWKQELRRHKEKTCRDVCMAISNAGCKIMRKQAGGCTLEERGHRTND